MISATHRKGAPAMTPSPLLRSPARRRATTLVEMMISVAILAILMGIVIPGMVFFARAVKGIRFENQLQLNVNEFVQRINWEMSAANDVNFVDDNGMEYTAYRSRFVAAGPTGSFDYIREVIEGEIFLYNPDGDVDTHEDNEIRLRKTFYSTIDGTLLETEERTLLRWVSPMLDDNGDPIPFFVDNTALPAGSADRARGFIEMTARIGDRQIPTVDADDRFSGPGYQGMTIRHIIAPVNNPVNN